MHRHRHTCRACAAHGPGRKTPPSPGAAGHAPRAVRLRRSRPAPPPPAGPVAAQASPRVLRGCASARDTGCSDWRASAAASASACSALTPCAPARPQREGVARERAGLVEHHGIHRGQASSACRRRTSTPRRANAPALASMAAGVASDSAHGQVTTSTATATISAWPGSLRPPEGTGTAGRHQHANQKRLGQAIGQLRDLRLGGGRKVHQRHDLGKRVLPDGALDAHLHRPTLRLWLPAITASPSPGAPGATRRSAATRRLGFALQHRAIGGERLARQHLHHVARLQASHRDRSKSPSARCRSTLSGRRFIKASSAPAVRSRRRSSSQRPVSRKNTNMVSESK
jgi:hypothetical protein